MIIAIGYVFHSRLRQWSKVLDYRRTALLLERAIRGIFEMSFVPYILHNLVHINAANASEILNLSFNVEIQVYKISMQEMSFFTPFYTLLLGLLQI